MTVKEQITELEKVVNILVRSKKSRVASGKYTEGELDYQIECCRAAIASLKNVVTMREQVKQCLETLNKFDFEFIQ